MLDHLRTWVKDGRQPPWAPPLAVASVLPEVSLVRDADGIVRGGIRLPDVDVPVALNGGGFNPGRTPQTRRLCRMSGQYRPFDATRLAALYPDADSYRREVRRVLGAAVAAGYVRADEAAKALNIYYQPPKELRP